MICQSCRLTALRAQRRLISLARTARPPSPSSPSQRRLTHHHHHQLAKPASSSSSQQQQRLFSSSSSPAAPENEHPHMSPAEASIAALLTSHLQPTQLLVQDISGGCGSMYAIDITSPAFRGLNILKQQRLVNAALGDLVKQWHGVQIRTKVPPGDVA